jgi:hypothetical protein
MRSFSVSSCYLTVVFEALKQEWHAMTNALRADWELHIFLASQIWRRIRSIRALPLSKALQALCYSLVYMRIVHTGSIHLRFNFEYPFTPKSLPRLWYQIVLPGTATLVGYFEIGFRRLQGGLFATVNMEFVH